MSDVIRLNSPIFPDGLSVGVSSDRSIAVIDFLSKKIFLKMLKQNLFLLLP